MRYLLDTSALLAHYRKEQGSAEVQRLFESTDSELLLASVSITEFGRRLRELGANERELTATVDAYLAVCDRIVPVDTVVARLALEVGEHSLGRVPLVDLLIAACAQSMDAILVNRDKHMASLSNSVKQLVLT